MTKRNIQVQFPPPNYKQETSFAAVKYFNSMRLDYMNMCKSIPFKLLELGNVQRKRSHHYVYHHKMINTLCYLDFTRHNTSHSRKHLYLATNEKPLLQFTQNQPNND